MTPAARNLAKAYSQARKRGANKFHAKKALHNGHLYHSMREADYARELDLRKKAGEVREWCRQVPIKLIVNDKLICTHVVDFMVEHASGHVSYDEVKGYETPEYRIKRKLLIALYPDMDYRVIK